MRDWSEWGRNEGLVGVGGGNEGIVGVGGK